MTQGVGQVSYDVVVIGAGVAGLTAGMYCANQGLRTVVLERMMPCNQIVNAEKIENFPGFPEPLTGGELGARVQDQAMRAGIELEMTEAKSLSRQDPYRIVTTAERTFRAKSVIIAAGSSLRSLGLPREEDFRGRGISQCATCDGPLFQGVATAVVGAGDSAADEALTLVAYSSRVFLLHRGDQISAQEYLRRRIRSAKVETIGNVVVEKLLGEQQLEGLQLRHTKTDFERTLDVKGLFVFTGLIPNSSFLSEIVDLDGAGHVAVNHAMETSVVGLYAVGDIRGGSSRQLVSAAGDGATAAIAAYRYIRASTWA